MRATPRDEPIQRDAQDLGDTRRRPDLRVGLGTRLDQGRMPARPIAREPVQLRGAEVGSEGPGGLKSPRQAEKPLSERPESLHGDHGSN
jgi:hypothetical protein